LTKDQFCKLHEPLKGQEYALGWIINMPRSQMPFVRHQVRRRAA